MTRNITLKSVSFYDTVPVAGTDHVRSAPTHRAVGVYRKVALPTEHGAWSMLLEPLIVGIAVAPSAAAFFVSVLFASGFLLRRPFNVYLADSRAGRSRPQTRAALMMLAAYGGAAVASLVGLVLTAPVAALVPLIVAVPLAAVQILYDATGKTRRRLPEALGAVALSSSAVMCALAAGWPTTAAAGLWLVLAFRLVTALLYVGERLRLEKKKSVAITLPLLAHVLSVVAVAALVFYGMASRLTLAVFVVLLTRAFVGLTRFRQPMKAMQIGITEVIYGLLTVASIIVGFYTGI